MEKPTPQETSLLVHLKHSKPVEVNEFVNALNSINNLYSSFVQEHGGCDKQAQAKLYVEKIQEGSIIVLLQELASASLLPFADNVNTVLDFASYVKSTLAYFIRGEGDKPDISLQDCNDFSEMLSLVSGDQKGKMEVGAVTKGNHNHIYVGCEINYTEGNAGQNAFKKEAARIKATAPKSQKYSKQLMTIHQLRGDMTRDVGNRAIIEGISKKKLPVIFETDELKYKILNSDSNPIKKAFFVDVEVQTISGKTVAYKVLALHDVIDIEE